MSEDLEEWLKKPETAQVVQEKKKDDFLDELEKHINDVKPERKEIPKAPEIKKVERPKESEAYEDEEEEDEEDYYEEEPDEYDNLTDEELKRIRDEVKDVHAKMSYRERVEARKREQKLWKERKKLEREERHRDKQMSRDKSIKSSEPEDLKKKTRAGRESRRKSLINRREKQRRENVKRWTIYRAITMIVAFAVMFLIFMYSTVQDESTQKQATFDIMILLGMTLFMPLGMLLGWGLLDPFMRCRIMRRVRRKNYGVVCFVSKGRRIIAHVKDFDDALIWVRNRCWAIRKNKIFEIDKYGEKISEDENINPEDLVIMTETVPMIFFDIDNMMPLTLHETNIEEVAPDELGPALKGWVDNQQAKLIFMKRTMEMFYMIILMATIGALFLTYQNYTILEEVTKTLTAIQNKLASISSQLSSAPASLILPFLGF